ncbi:MAG TPA: hypothetical protein VGC97_07480 [Pyrinomonadaceae bacterium]|jgi:hypothetical protein
MGIFDTTEPAEPSLWVKAKHFFSVLWEQTVSAVWTKLKRLFWHLFSNFGFREVAYHFTWSVGKNIQIIIRSHLSHFLAFVLAILVLIRETPEFLELFHDLNKFIWSWHSFIILITFGTILAALWELRGDKLATTEQERRFIVGVRNLLIELEKFKDAVKSLSDSERQEKLKTFTENFVDIASGVICGKKKVDVAVLIYNESDNEGFLNLYASSKDSVFPSDFNLHLPLHNIDDKEKGPAFMAFTSGLIAHMPNKTDRFGFLFKEISGENYKFEHYIDGWYSVKQQYENYEQYENYRSILSVPISSYINPNEREAYGVLSFTTSYRDPFIPRDYIMALCLSNLLSQAIDVVNYPVLPENYTMLLCLMNLLSRANNKTVSEEQTPTLT